MHAASNLKSGLQPLGLFFPPIMFFRLNGDSHRAALARSRWHAMRSSPSATTNRLVRAINLARNIGWFMILVHRRHKIVPERYPAGCKSFAIDIDNKRVRMVADNDDLWGSQVPKWPLLSLFTDGSWHALENKQKGVSSWGICVGSDWLIDNHYDVEPERSISRATKRQVVVFGGSIPAHVTSGNFDAELTAIARAIISVPIRCSIKIITDSMSSKQAIHAHQSCTNHRKRCRMAGRPLLAMIDNWLSRKAAVGGDVIFQWVPAHTNGHSLAEVGNRLADDYAGDVRDTKKQLARRCEANFDLAAYDAFVTIRVGDEKGPVLTSDPRTSANRAVCAEHVDVWSSSKSQSLFSARVLGCKALWHCVQNHQPRWCGMVMQIISDTVQWSKDGGSVGERRCRCGGVVEIRHLLQCQQYHRSRVAAAEAVADILEPFMREKVLKWRSGPAVVEELVKTLGMAEVGDSRGNMAACVGAFDDRKLRQLLRAAGPDLTIHNTVNNVRLKLVAWFIRALQ